MKRNTRHPIWSWIIHTPWVLAVLGILSILAFFGSGAGNPLLSRLITHRLEAMTGGKGELRSLSIQWPAIGATLKGLVIHGKEPGGAEPLFSAEEVQAGLRIDSIWRRKVSVNELQVQKPHVHVRVDKDGTSNVPTPPRPALSNKSTRDTLFELRIRILLL